MKELSYNLKRLRKKRNLKQTDLAEKVGVSSTFIANIEQGKRKPSMEIIQKIVNALQIKPKELFEDIPNE
jgi:transcriptional regulator with XRE-family HTH domain